MTIEEKAKEYHDSQYHMPINERELAEFTRLILDEFITELESNAMGATCNGSLHSVLFKDRQLDSVKNLETIKKEFLCRK